MGVTVAEDGAVGARSVGTCGGIGGMEDCFTEVEGRGVDLQGHAMAPSCLVIFSHREASTFHSSAISPFCC